MKEHQPSLSSTNIVTFLSFKDLDVNNGVK